MTACTYFQKVDPLYPSKAMEVIDGLVMENRELWDVLIEERTNQYWMHEEDMAVDASLMSTVAHLQNMLGLAAGVIVLAAILAAV